MKKSNKQLIFERMGLGFKPTTNEDDDGYGEMIGKGKGLVSVLVGNIDDAIKYIDEMIQNSPELATDLENIKKRLTIRLENARIFSEGKEHKRKDNIRGMWGVDDDDDGLVDGSADGGGESYTPIKEGINDDNSDWSEYYDRYYRNDYGSDEEDDNSWEDHPFGVDPNSREAEEEKERKLAYNKSSQGFNQFLNHISQWERMYGKGDVQGAFHFLEKQAEEFDMDIKGFREYLGKLLDKVKSSDSTHKMAFYPKYEERLPIPIKIIDYAFNKLDIR